MGSSIMIYIGDQVSELVKGTVSEITKDISLAEITKDISLFWYFTWRKIGKK